MVSLSAPTPSLSLFTMIGYGLVGNSSTGGLPWLQATLCTFSVKTGTDVSWKYDKHLGIMHLAW